MDDKYTGRQIAILTDIHGLLEPTEAIMQDIKARGITEIYSLGDNIGDGPNPKEVVDLLDENGVVSIAGNAEEYVRLGMEPFPYILHSYTRKESCLWTLSKLGEKEIGLINLYPHFIELVVGGKKVALCHFANDVRFSFGNGFSTWSYQGGFDYSGTGARRNENASSQFYNTNSENEQSYMDAQIQRNGEENPEMRGIISAKKDPLFAGRTVGLYDAIIQGHVHWKLYDENEQTSFYTIRAAGMAYRGDPVDSASYVILREKKDNKGFDLVEVLVTYDRKKMVASILDCQDRCAKMRQFTCITPEEEEEYYRGKNR